MPNAASAKSREKHSNSQRAILISLNIASVHVSRLFCRRYISSGKSQTSLHLFPCGNPPLHDESRTSYLLRSSSRPRCQLSKSNPNKSWYCFCLCKPPFLQEIYFQWHWQVQMLSNDNLTPGNIFKIIYFAKLWLLYSFFSSTVDILSTVIYILQRHSIALH